MTVKVEIVRQSITKVTQMLAGMSIDVTQRGDKAFVLHSTKTGKPVRVNIPFLPDGASEELIAAVQGFLDHEVAHVLFTDPKALAEAKSEGKALDKMHNIVEDCFIETMMIKRFRGSNYNLGNTRKLVFDTRARPTLEKMIANGNTSEEEMFSALVTTIFRALAGHKECQDFMDDGDKWQFIPNIVKALSFFPIGIQNCRNSFDALELARKALKALRDINDREEEKEDEDDKDDKEKEESEDSEEDPGEGDPGEGDPGEGDDSSSSSSESSSGSKSKDKGDEDDDTGDDEEGDNSDSAENDEDSDEASGKDEKSEDESGGDDSEGDDEKSDVDADDENETSSDDSDESESDDSDESDSEDGKSGDESDDGTSDDDETSGDEDGDDDETSGDEDGDEDGDEESADSDMDVEMIVKGVEESKDFSDEVSAEVTKVYSDLASSGAFGNWMIFSREYDDPKPYPVTSAMTKEVAKMTGEVNSMIGPMAKQLERLILARKRSLFEPGKRSGRLHAANLHRLQSGDDRIFRRKFDYKVKDTAVEILVDMSGSMHGNKMKTASYSAFALSSMLQRVNIPNEVFSFSTTEGSSEYSEEMKKAELRLGRRFSHEGVCLHLLLKGFNERIDANTTRRFAHLGSNGGSAFMSQNCDPESVYAAAMRLAKRSEERRVLMVLSDGHPAFYGDMHSANKRLKEVVHECESAGIDVVGIGIEDSSVKAFYPKNVVLSKAKDLPAAIMGEMQGLLLK